MRIPSVEEVDEIKWKVLNEYRKKYGQRMIMAAARKMDHAGESWEEVHEYLNRTKKDSRASFIAYSIWVRFLNILARKIGA